VEQVAKFPNAEHDDYVDTYTQALHFLRDSGYFELAFAEPDEVEEVDYAEKKKAKANPYAQ
jgi:hypothetical protein